MMTELYCATSVFSCLYRPEEVAFARSSFFISASAAFSLELLSWIVRPNFPISDCALLELTMMFHTSSSVVSSLSMGHSSHKSYPDIPSHFIVKLVRYPKCYRILSAHHDPFVYAKIAPRGTLAGLPFTLFLYIK